MDYQIETLGPERFQQFCQALLVREYPGVQCFPVGQPDGGRDAISPVEGGSAGFNVFQIKFVRQPQAVADARKWVLEIIDAEAEKVKRLIERGAKQYFLITNVAGTGHLDVGSIDLVTKRLIAAIAPNPSQCADIKVQCWWRDDLNRRLDAAWDIKLKYPEVMSGQDYLRLLFESAAGQEQSRRLKAINAFLADQYQEDVEVKFKQVELHNKLLDLFIDLPFDISLKADKWKKNTLITAGLPIISYAEPDGSYNIVDYHEDREGVGTATLLLGEYGGELLQQIVMEGAPGQGKSTLAQYLCQVHRIRWLNKQFDADRLPEKHKQTALRIPFKVDLRDLASWLSGTDPFNLNEQTELTIAHRSLETFLAWFVRHHSGGIDFDVNDLLEVSKLAPLLIVLDGLDEVADVKNRGEVVNEVTRALPRLRENCPRINVVITSRPPAFTNSPGFDDEHFPHLQLGSVTRRQIDAYANRWMEVRSLSPKERAEFQQILNEKLDQPHLRDLARNPMQLAILLSLIHTRGAALPDKRTNLYDAYVDLFFSREAGKSPTVRQYVDLLKDIHRYLAWILHSSAETGRSRGRISYADLRTTLEGYLKREQHQTDIIEEVFGTMLERVVMIVSRVEGVYEFEVQPLREYFAARYLYDTASYSPPGRERTGTKPDRFDAISRNFYWLNVTRFFAGCFSKGELLDLADRVRELVNDKNLGRSRHPASLGAMLLSDWVFAQSPKAMSEVISVLSSREVLRNLLSTSSQYRDRVIQIPERCGGSDLVRLAFDFLENSHTRADLAHELVTFIKANEKKDAISRRWMKGASNALASDVPRWLDIGRRLGCLREAEKVEILRAIGDTELNAESIRTLHRSGRYDCILTNHANASKLESLILNSPSLRVDHEALPPLYLVPTFFSLWLHIARGYLNHQPAKTQLKSFRSPERDVQPQLELPFLFQFGDQARSLSIQFANAVDEAGAMDVVPISKWEALIEEARRFWGEGPAVVSFANAVCCQRRGGRAKNRAENLWDSQAAICDRIRSAKYHTKDATWWMHNLTQADDPERRFFFLLMFWCWASFEVALETAPAVSQELEKLTPEQWEPFLSCVVPFINRDLRSHPKLDEPFPVTVTTFRFAFLMAIKEKSRFSRALFSDYLLNMKDTVGFVAEIRQALAWEAAYSGELDWRTALSIVRTNYAKGAFEGMHRAVWRPTRSKRNLPDAVVQQVLGSAHEYPVQLWEMVQAIETARVRKTVKPVARVAKAERWFHQ